MMTKVLSLGRKVVGILFVLLVAAGSILRTQPAVATKPIVGCGAAESPGVPLSYAHRVATGRAEFEQPTCLMVWWADAAPGDTAGESVAPRVTLVDHDSMYVFDPPPSGTTSSEFVATKAVPCASFRADTLVVMADGTRKKISEIEVGDQVVATNPETGETSVRTVTKLWTHIDDDLLDVVVLTEDRRETIHTTEHHRFWNDTTKQWVDAKDLRAGDRLRTTDGDIVIVGGLTHLLGRAPMLDLTVDTDHTFYVALTATAVLVHNQTCTVVQLADDMASGASPSGKGGLTRAGHSLTKHGVGARPGNSAFPAATGNPAAINATAQGVLDDILTTGARQPITGGNFAGGYKVIAPDGRFAVYDKSGVFQYFGE